MQQSVGGLHCALPTELVDYGNDVYTTLHHIARLAKAGFVT